MTTQTTSGRSSLAFDPPRGEGPLVILLPGAGDVRTENRFLADALVTGGYRVVAADLPGHGSSPLADRYGVQETSRALDALIGSLGGGPAAIIATSFAPTAAVWSATEKPGSIAAVVAISPHFDEDTSVAGRMQRLAIRLLMRGPFAGRIWEKLYRGWYKAAPPADLAAELAAIRRMLEDPQRRRAVRDTLTAARTGVAERMAALRVPSLVIFGADDDHFADPAAEAASLVERLSSQQLLVEGAGHYPHVEQPEVVAPAILGFLSQVHR